MLLLFVAFNKTTVARYDADRRGIHPIILARCPVLPEHFNLRGLGGTSAARFRLSVLGTDH